MKNSSALPFWQSKTFAQMSKDEWESLCDGCAKCCLHKLEDEDTGDVYYTDVACRYLDEQTCRCKDYSQRQQLVKECLQLRPQDVQQFDWLPSTCSYRLLAEGESLPLWHPLLSGKPDLVHQLGFSVKGKVISEKSVAADDYEEHVIHWID
ncbi:MAG: putative cysteine cluster protein YcgN (CxxCxxCC family) [Kiritimatiellia bacterium]